MTRSKELLGYHVKIWALEFPGKVGRICVSDPRYTPSATQKESIASLPGIIYIAQKLARTRTEHLTRLNKFRSIREYYHSKIALFFLPKPIDLLSNCPPSSNSCSCKTFCLKSHGKRKTRFYRPRLAVLKRYVYQPTQVDKS